jgi:uncharacterized protein involved in exopolysaccharide biosynthesis
MKAYTTQPSDTLPSLAPSFVQFALSRKKVIGMTTLGSAAFMLGYVLFGYVPSFTSDSMVMIKDSVLTSKLVSDEEHRTTTAAASSNVLNTMNLLNTDGVSKAVYNFFRLQHPEELQLLEITNYMEWREFYKDGSKFLTSRNKPGTDIIMVKFKWSKDAEITQQAHQVALKAFQQASREVNKAEYQERSQYLAEQYLTVKAELEAVRKQISQMKRANRTADIEQKRAEMTIARVDLQRSLSQAESDARAEAAKLARYQKSLGMTAHQALAATAIGSNTALSEAYNRYNQISQDHAQKASLYTDKSPEMKEVKAQLAAAEQTIQSELKRVLGNDAPETVPVFSDDAHMKSVSDMVMTQANVAQYSTKASALRSEIGKMDREISQVPEVEENLANLTQEEDSLSESLKTLQEKMLEARLKDTQAASNVLVVDAPSVPIKPDPLNEKHLMVLSLLLGAGLGVAYQYYKWNSLFNNSIPKFTMNLTENEYRENLYSVENSR